MTSDGYILTNKHVVQNAAQIIVALQTGSISNAKLVGDDTLTDLAVLKLKRITFLRYRKIMKDR
ncbi:protease DegS [Actinobacillus pleuropneumoniae]|nr:protease DegS [Actinobacillus pleuropneumoniae]